MKKMLLVHCLLGVAVTCCAQQHASSTSWAAQTIKTKAGFLNDINARAAGDFLKRYRDADEATWYQITEGFAVFFNQKNIKTKAVYDKNGNWQYTMRFYKEQQMLHSIRHIVKREYYDFTITQVEEIHYQNQPVVYVVHMQDDSTWMNVRVSEGEMQVLEKYSKSK